MARGLRIAVFGVVGLVVLVSSLPAIARATSDNTPASGRYEGQYTVVSFTPDPGLPGVPGVPTRRPPSPQAGTVTFTCSDGAACSATLVFVGTVSLTRQSTDHYHGRLPFDAGGGCKIDTPSVTTVVDLQFSGTNVTARIVQPAGRYTYCGRSVVDGSRSGATRVFHGTLVGAPAPVPTTPGRGTGRSVGRVAALSSRQRASVAAVRAGRRSAVPASLQSPSEALKNAGHVAQNALLAALLVLLLVFPSQLFNSTFDEHHERIESAWRRRFRRPRGERASTQELRAAAYLVVVLVGALLAGFLDPHFGLHTASVALFVGVIVSTLFATTLGGLINREYRRIRHQPTHATLVAVPAGLVIAFVGVVVSRSVHFQPGYLYGLVGGFSFIVALDQRDEGRSQFVAFVVRLLMAIVAWVLFVPVSHAANHLHPNVGVLVVDAFLAAVFIGGIEGALFSLVPLRFLPGHHVSRWSWTAWAVLAFATAFLFVDVLLRPQGGYLGRSSTASGLVTYGLFTLFGVASVAFWGWFRTHPDPEPSSEPEVAPNILAR
jgi:hypothetical protein